MRPPPYFYCTPIIHPGYIEKQIKIARQRNYLYPADNSILSSLYSACNNTLNNIFLAYQVNNNDRDNIDHNTCHHRSHLYMTEASAEVLYCHRNGTVFLNIQYQGRQKIVIPYPHQLKDCSGDNGRLQDWNQDLEKYL